MASDAISVSCSLHCLFVFFLEIFDEIFGAGGCVSASCFKGGKANGRPVTQTTDHLILDGSCPCLFLLL